MQNKSQEILGGSDISMQLIGKGSSTRAEVEKVPLFPFMQRSSVHVLTDRFMGITVCVFVLARCRPGIRVGGNVVGQSILFCKEDQI